MGKSFVSLGDFFPEQRITCEIPGCSNLLIDSKKEEKQGEEPSPDSDVPEGACQECREILAGLSDREAPCVKSDCSGSWSWSRKSQLEAFRKAQSEREKKAGDEKVDIVPEDLEPPQRLCEECRRKANELGDMKVPCKVPGCGNHWIWKAEDRYLSETGIPDEGLCTECEKKLRNLRDQQIRCNIEGCRNSWTWTAWEQLENLAGEGGGSRKKPSRPCRECREQLAQMEDRYVPCRVPGCRRHWVLSAKAQLRHRIMHGADVDPAAGAKRLCDECYEFYRKAEPRRIPCRTKGCRNTWVYSPRRQLQDFARGYKHPPPWRCDHCRARLKELEPLQKPCATPGCEGTWSWSPEDQLQKEVRQKERGRESEPSGKHCPDCENFLHNESAKTLYCNECGQEISWSVYEQLLCQRGSFAKPARCSECARKEVNKERARPEDFISRNTNNRFTVPVRGPWLNKPEIAHRPPGITHQTRENLKKADFRIVAFGDGATALSNQQTDWPALLEDNLNNRLADQEIKVAVVNSGIPDTDSRLGALRIARDVEPYMPHLVIISFVLADLFIPYNPDRPEDWQNRRPEEESIKTEEDILKKLNNLPAGLLYWLPNPVFPYDSVSSGDDHHNKHAWAGAVEARSRQIRARIHHLCQRHNVELLDIGSKFEIGGRRSATKWMADPFIPNAAGIRNIANWMTEAVLRHESLKSHIGSPTG